MIAVPWPPSFIKKPAASASSTVTENDSMTETKTLTIDPVPEVPAAAVNAVRVVHEDQYLDKTVVLLAPAAAAAAAIPLSSPTINKYPHDDFSISSIGTDEYLGAEDMTTRDDNQQHIINAMQVRLNEERELIKKFDRAFINPGHECWFLVDAEFLTHAARYVQGSISHRPGPFSTRNLIDRLSKKPVPGLIVGMDYRGITPVTYFLYSILYGQDEDSPDVCRFIVNIYANEVSPSRRREIARNAKKLAQAEVVKMEERIAAAVGFSKDRKDPAWEGHLRRKKESTCTKLCCCLKMLTGKGGRRLAYQEEQGEEEDVDHRPQHEMTMIPHHLPSSTNAAEAGSSPSGGGRGDEEDSSITANSKSGEEEHHSSAAADDDKILLIAKDLKKNKKGKR